MYSCSVVVRSIVADNMPATRIRSISLRVQCTITYLTAVGCWGSVRPFIHFAYSSSSRSAHCSIKHCSLARLLVGCVVRSNLQVLLFYDYLNGCRVCVCVVSLSVAACSSRAVFDMIDVHILYVAQCAVRAKKRIITEHKSSPWCATSIQMKHVYNICACS